MGVDIFIKNNRVYATDLDIKEAGNPKCTFNLTRLDGRFAVKQLEAAFEKNVLEAEQALPYEKRCEILHPTSQESVFGVGRTGESEQRRRLQFIPQIHRTEVR